MPVRAGLAICFSAAYRRTSHHSKTAELPMIASVSQWRRPNAVPPPASRGNRFRAFTPPRFHDEIGRVVEAWPRPGHDGRPYMRRAHVPRV
jgi:hypothetical protein